MRIQQPTYYLLAFVIFCLATLVACNKETTEVEFSTFQAPAGYELIEIGNLNVSLVDAIHFPTKEIGYYVQRTSPFQSLLKTIDGGWTWKVVRVLHNQINYLFFIDENVGFAIEAGPGAPNSIDYTMCRMYRTLDGGESWDSIALIECLSFTDFVLDSEENLYTLTRSSHRASVLKSSDLGEHWDTIFTISGYYPLTEIDIFNDQLYLIGKLPQMYILDTNGQVIKTPTFPSNLILNKLYILDQDTYIFEELKSNSQPFLHHTGNGGQTWNQISEHSSILLDYKYAEEFIIYSRYEKKTKMNSGWYSLIKVTDDGGQSYSTSLYKGLLYYTPQVPRHWRDEYFFLGPSGLSSLRKK
jgi:photosystem II stability/assembly factor-like uncharacterized protein